MGVVSAVRRSHAWSTVFFSSSKALARRCVGTTQCAAMFAAWWHPRQHIFAGYLSVSIIWQLVSSPVGWRRARAAILIPS